MEKDADQPNVSHELRRLAVDPDLQKPHPMFVRFLETNSSGGKTFTSGRPLIESVRALKPGDLALPDSIVEVAARPIVRRANHAGLSSHGNARDVVLARRLLYQELEGGHEFVNKLLSALASREAWQDDFAHYTHVWQALSVHRILASPHIAYWDRLASQREMNTVRLVVCPKCGGSI